MSEDPGFHTTEPVPGAAELRPPRAEEGRAVTADASSDTTGPAPGARLGLRRIRAGAVIAIALLIGFGAWLVLRDRSSSSTSTVPQRSPAVPVSVKGLKTIAALGLPIYWVGERPGFTYELTKTDDNRVFIRYLPAGVPVGTKDPYLTVGTYPVNDAFAVTSRLAGKTDSVTIDIGKGGVAFYNQKAPTNVYLAYPGSNSQIEVYDPSAAEARQLVSSGQVAPVVPGSSSSTTSGANAVSPAALRSLAASLQHPVYWAGGEPGVTYELTQTSDGRVYLRYLPKGVAVGTKEPHLTIGTYPVTNAFGVTRKQSRTPGTVHIKVGGGAVAFYKKSRPTNVYVAYPGVDLQVEVYDPSPGRAGGLVASQSVTPVR